MDTKEQKNEIFWEFFTHSAFDFFNSLTLMTKMSKKLRGIDSSPFRNKVARSREFFASLVVKLWNSDLLICYKNPRYFSYFSLEMEFAFCSSWDVFKMQKFIADVLISPLIFNVSECSNISPLQMWLQSRELFRKVSQQLPSEIE